MTTPAEPRPGLARWIAAAFLAGVAGTSLLWSLTTNRQSPPLISPATASQATPTTAPADATAPQATRSPATATPAASPTTAGLNINTATQAQLESLPQVGPATAKAIIAWRETHGAFRTLSDLDKVRGIGPRTIEKLRPLIRFE